MSDPRPDPEVAHLRVPPHSIEAEQGVLGGLLLDNQAWDRAGDILTDRDFYSHQHRLIYAVIGHLINANRPADLFTVYARLESLGKHEESGGMAYLNNLTQSVAGAGNIRRYAEIVRERAILRQLISASDEIATRAFNTDGQSIDAILDLAERNVFQIREQGVTAADEWQDIDKLVCNLLDRVTDEYQGTSLPDIVPTGLTELDERLDGGMRPGELVVVGARPSMGKSALAGTIAYNVADTKAHGGGPVGIFSMEMPAPQYTNRLVSLVSGIHLSKLKRPERLRDTDWSSLSSGIERMGGLAISINDASGLTINHIRAKARALKRRTGLRLLVLDYLGLMDGVDPKQSRTYQLEDITKGLKRLAKELRIPIMLLVQLSREVEKRADQTPILSDLRDSGAIEQDADIVMFVHRPFKANPGMAEEWREYAKLSVAKLRDGDPGTVHLKYIGENTHFLNWPADEPVPSSRVRTKGDL